MEGDAKDYAGTIARSLTGHCLNWTTVYNVYDHKIAKSMWDSITDDNFPEKSVYNAMNYCRSPNSDARPWCANDGAGDFTVEYCDIPRCEGNI